MGQVRRVLRELANKKLNETQPGFGQQPKPSSGKLVGEPRSFWTKDRAGTDQSAKKLRGGNARAPSHPRRGAGTQNSPQE